MKLDLDLVREILHCIEDSPEARVTDLSSLPNYDHEQVAYHIELMEEGGLITGNFRHGARTRFTWQDIRPTWDGHQFSMAARDEKLWKQAMGYVGERTGVMSFGVAMQLLTHLAKQQLGMI